MNNHIGSVESGNTPLIGQGVMLGKGQEVMPNKGQDFDYVEGQALLAG
jgi:hypothetical protein